MVEIAILEFNILETLHCREEQYREKMTDFGVREIWVGIWSHKPWKNYVPSVLTFLSVNLG